MFFIPAPVLPPPSQFEAVSFEKNYTTSNIQFKDKNKISYRIIFRKDKEIPEEDIKAKSLQEDKNLYKIEKNKELDEKFHYIKNLSSINKLTLKQFVDDFTSEAISKNLFSFPITNPEKIKDPKTKELPKILIPKGINKESATQEKITKVEFLPPPKKDDNGIQRIIAPVEPNALIWLPKPYLIAGSFHTEIYPHDTSSVIWSLLELLKTDLVKKDFIQVIKDQLENFAFQVNTFGFPLNGNRGYFITRSQTNIIPANVLQFYNVTSDKKWLEEVGLPLSKSIFEYWTHNIARIKVKPRLSFLDPYTWGLLTGYRWIAHGQGPCIEVTDSHKEHNYYYFKVLTTLVEYSLIHDLERPGFARGFDYKKVVEVIPEKVIKESNLIPINDVPFKTENSDFYYLNGSVPVLKFMNNYYKLTPFYYLNDRASRVSGYDTNHLYGPFNSFTYDFIPVDHNLILYKSALDISEMYKILGDDYHSKQFKIEAKKLKRLITNILWDDNLGMFFEYDSSLKKLRTNYPFSSAGYAFLAKIFDLDKPSEKEMLIKMVQFMEDNLEGPNGIYASGIETGLHWDKPYTWPVQQVYIVGGLRSYAKDLQDAGYFEDANYLTEVADRISIKYLLANYADWLKSKGKEIGEKVIEGEENLLTGYATGSNYTWNLTAVMYLYYNLSENTKELLESKI